MNITSVYIQKLEIAWMHCFGSQAWFRSKWHSPKSQDSEFMAIFLHYFVIIILITNWINPKKDIKKFTIQAKPHNRCRMQGAVGEKAYSFTEKRFLYNEHNIDLLQLPLLWKDFCWDPVWHKKKLYNSEDLTKFFILLWHVFHKSKFKMKPS